MANILIVDDSRTSRRILRGILEGDGHTVSEALNGEEGVIIYDKAKIKFDLVTMDITMPVMDGIQALKEIKAKYPDAKIVMVTAAGQKHNMVEAVQSGAAEFIAKPFDMDQILKVVNMVLKN